MYLEYYSITSILLPDCHFVGGVSVRRLGKYGWDDDMQMWGVGWIGPPPKYTNMITHHLLTHADRREVTLENCQALVPNPLVPNPQSRGLGLTIKS